MSESIYLTVVIPTYNERKYLYDTLETLASQDYPKDRYELLVVDGRSTDDTSDTVERFISEHPEVNVRLLDNPRRLSSGARNVGVRAASGRLVAVIDGHVYVPNRHLFAKMEQLKERFQALCLARPAPMLVPGLGKDLAVWIALARKSWMGHSVNSHIYSTRQGFVDPISSGFAYDRQVFELVGHFDETFDAAEDVEFNYRLSQMGVRAYTAPELTIYSYPRGSLRGLFDQMVRYGAGRARFLRKHVRAFTKETLVPPAVFAFFATLPLTALLFRKVPAVGVACALAFVAYLMAALSTGFSSAPKRRRWLGGPMIALAIFVSHMGLGWGFLKTVFLPRSLLERRYPEENVPPQSGGTHKELASNCCVSRVGDAGHERASSQ